MGRSRAGEELAELLWDASGPALRTANFPPAPFHPFTCSAAGSTRAHELPHTKTHAAAMGDDLGGAGVPVHDDDDAVPWLHCPVIDDGDSDTAPLPPEYYAGLQMPDTGYHQAAAAVPDPAPPPPETKPLPGEGVMNFTFFSRPLQRPSTAAAPSNPLESTVVQTAASRLRSTPLFSEQRMAWLQPPPPSAKAPPRSTAVAPDQHPHFAEAGGAAAVTQQQHRFLQPYPADARRAPPPPPPPDAAAVTTSSVCSGNGDRSQTHQARRSHQQPTAECSVSQDEDMMDDEPSGAARVRSSAARGTKRSRTAEVHNLSERRRRDRINEKMRALQELIPNCNKIDKASMLEEAIEYLKTLQLQLQMMSMGAAAGLCMPQMLMHPMAAAPFPHLGMGLGFGMGPVAAFDMLPRFAAAQFPHMMPGAPPPMAMPPGAMFGMPGGQVMHSPAAFAAYMNAAALPEHREPAVPVPPPGGGADAGDQPPVAVAPQGDRKLEHPNQ